MKQANMIIKSKLGVTLIEHTIKTTHYTEVTYEITFNSYIRYTQSIDDANKIYNSFIKLKLIFDNITNNINKDNILKYLIENTLLNLNSISKENYIIIKNIINLAKSYKLDTDYIDSIKTRFDYFKFE